MVYPRKYLDRLTTAVNIERKKKELLDLLNIKLTYAVNFGADILIDDAIKRGRNICPEALVIFKELNEIENTEIKEYIRLKTVAESVLSEIRNTATTSESQRSLSDFFDENIRDILPKDVLDGYVRIIFNSSSAYEQITNINQLLDASGELNSQKTYAGSHDTNDVYNWLVELKRGGL